MSAKLMIDNWTLQDVDKVLHQGVSSQSAGEISIASDRGTHGFSAVPMGVLHIDALITLLTNLVCFETLTVDSAFISTWKSDRSQLNYLVDCGVVAPQSYIELNDDLSNVRERITDELCVTPTLKQAMQGVRSAWESNRPSPDPHLSALVWGGAGMLARSHLTGTPYFGHPVRRRLIQESRLFPSQGSASEVVTNFLQTERAKMFRFRGAQIAGGVAHVSVPPLAVRAIEDSDCIEQLLPAAINIRDQNKELRAWIAGYQKVIDDENEKELLRHERLLSDLGRYLQNQYGSTESAGTGISLSAAFLSVEVPRSMVDRVRNTFGIRSTLCKLVMAPRGQKALEKLLKLLGEDKSLLGRDVLAALKTRYAA